MRSIEVRFPWLVAGVLYALMALFTFGHSFTGYKQQPDVSLELNQQKQGAGAFLSALCWPIYWSIELQEAKQGEQA